MMLTGLRGVGKTVLLGEFGRIGKEHGWVHQQIEVTEDLDFPKAMADLSRQAILRLSAGQRMVDLARRPLQVLRSFQMRWHLPEGSEIVLGVEPEAGFADSGQLEYDLADLFLEIGELARSRKVGALFTIDEIQYLSRDHLMALIIGLHRVSQEQSPFVVVGAGLPSLPALAGEARSYAERLFVFRNINSLAGADAEAALVRPADSEGVRWRPEALTEVVRMTAGYPYFLQEFGKQAWNVATGPDEIVLADIAPAKHLATEELDTGFFRVRMDRTTDAERAYLLAMASLGSGPHASGDVAGEMGRTTPQVGQLRDALIKKGLCYAPRHGVIAFTVPMLDQFVLRHFG